MFNHHFLHTLKVNIDSLPNVLLCNMHQMQQKVIWHKIYLGIFNFTCISYITHLT